MVRRKEERKGMMSQKPSEQSSQNEGLAKTFKCSRLSKMRNDNVSYTGNITQSAQIQWWWDREVLVQRSPEITWG